MQPFSCSNNTNYIYSEGRHGMGWAEAEREQKKRLQKDIHVPRVLHTYGRLLFVGCVCVCVLKRGII